MGGLNKIAKMYGGITLTDRDGNKTEMVWDYVADKAVPKSEMKPGSERWKASERKKWEGLREQLDARKKRASEGF